MRDYSELFSKMLLANPELSEFHLKLTVSKRSKHAKFGVLSITDATGQIGSDYILTSSDIDRSDETALIKLFYPMIDNIIQLIQRQQCKN